jgi:hypothetical protein
MRLPYLELALSLYHGEKSDNEMIGHLSLPLSESLDFARFFNVYWFTGLSRYQ